MDRKKNNLPFTGITSFCKAPICEDWRQLEAEVAAYNAAKVAYLDANRDLIGFDEEYQKSRKRVEDKQKGTTRTTSGGVTYEVID